jgi:hypothetical protein
MSEPSSHSVGYPSLCIPRVFANITEKRVEFVIKNVGLGDIHRIDMVPKVGEDGTKFQRVFIHFKRWGSSEAAQRARERVLSGKEIKIIYDDPWFWKLSASRAVVRSTNDEPSGVKPRQKRPLPKLIDTSSSENDGNIHYKKTSNCNATNLNLLAPDNQQPEDHLFTPSSPIDPPPSTESWTTVQQSSKTKR